MAILDTDKYYSFALGGGGGGNSPKANYSAADLGEGVNFLGATNKQFCKFPKNCMKMETFCFMSGVAKTFKCANQARLISTS